MSVQNVSSVLHHPAAGSAVPPAAPVADNDRAIAAQERRLAFVAGEAVQRSMAGRTNAFVPLLLLSLGLLLVFGWQAYDALAQRHELLAAHAAQQQTVDNASKLRGSLDALAADTQRLADGGNGNAALLVAELRKRGITISVPGAGAAAPAAPAASAAR